MNALKAYCLYLYIMGVNGIAEAFLYGSINKEDLKLYRIFIFISTGFMNIIYFYIKLHKYLFNSMHCFYPIWIFGSNRSKLFKHGFYRPHKIFFKFIKRLSELQFALFI